MIHFKGGDRCAPYFGLSLKYDRGLLRPLEMIRPNLRAGVEQRNNPLRFGINRFGVSPLASVAVWTGKRQVGQIRRAIFVSRNDVVDGKPADLPKGGQVAIFTTIASASCDFRALAFGN